MSDKPYQKLETGARLWNIYMQSKAMPILFSHQRARWYIRLIAWVKFKMYRWKRRF